MNTIMLVCWVYGEDPNKTFLVDIQKTKTVSALKEVIKDKADPRFRDVPAYDLELYKHPITSPGDDLEAELKQWNPIRQNKLSAQHELQSSLEQDVKWLIIVSGPGTGSRITKPHVAIPIITLNCWVRGTGLTNVFPVKMSCTELVGTLKKVIKDKADPRFRDVPADDLALYKASIPSDDRVKENLENLVLKKEDSLQPMKTLSYYFPGDPLYEHIHIVIEAPTSAKGRKRHLEVVEEESVMVEKVKRARLAEAAPSHAAKPSVFRSWHDKDVCLIDHRRNYDKESLGDELPYSDHPPISLQYEGLGLFLDIFWGRTDVPGTENVQSATLRSAVDTFADRMAEIYDSEDSRSTVGLPALNDILTLCTDRQPLALQTGTIDTKSIFDGHLLGPHKAIYCIVGFKNEQGVGTAIPYVEMAGYFAHSIKQVLSSRLHDLKKLMSGWNPPCLGMTIVGHYVTFYAMLFIGEGRWRVDSLTPALSCIRVASGGEERTALCNAFTAALVLLTRIKEDAARLVCEPPEPFTRGGRILPAISSLRRPHSDSSIRFRIIELFPPLTTDRLLYIAKMDDGTDILIKFTRRYSLELHTFCADRGEAPQLLGFERLPGGYFAIAMGFASSFSRISNQSSSPYTREWREQLQTLVASFHAENLVHGDLRHPNIMCDGKKVMIVDFDWAGKEGEVSYPDGWLASELTDGRGNNDLKITKDDDLRVLCKTLTHLGLGCDYCRDKLGLQ